MKNQTRNNCRSIIVCGGLAILQSAVRVRAWWLVVRWFAVVLLRSRAVDPRPPPLESSAGKETCCDDESSNAGEDANHHDHLTVMRELTATQSNQEAPPSHARSLCPSPCK